MAQMYEQISCLVLWFLVGLLRAVLCCATLRDSSVEVMWERVGIFPKGNTEWNDWATPPALFQLEASCAVFISHHIICVNSQAWFPVITPTSFVTWQLLLCPLTPPDLCLLPCNLPSRLLRISWCCRFGFKQQRLTLRKASGQKQNPAFSSSCCSTVATKAPGSAAAVKAEATLCHLAHSSAANLHDETSSCVFIYTVICTVTDESVCETAVPNSDSFSPVYITQLWQALQDISRSIC